MTDHPANCDCAECWAEIERHSLTSERFGRIAASMYGRDYHGDLHHLKPLGVVGAKKPHRHKLPKARPR